METRIPPPGKRGNQRCFLIMNRRVPKSRAPKLKRARLLGSGTEDKGSFKRRLSISLTTNGVKLFRISRNTKWPLLDSKKFSDGLNQTRG